MTIRTYKPRRGRVTPRQAAALAVNDGLLLPLDERPLDLDVLFTGHPVVLEIGFGTGAATVEMAAADPAIGILAVDIHTPGVGDLVHRVRTMGLTNVRVIEGDALLVLRTMIPEGGLAGVRTFFPDPWPKARHHKRRLVTAEHATLIGARCRPGATWHLATDWAPYAEQMRDVLDAHPMWSGGVIDRPADRPITRYESFAIADGRKITDLRYGRQPDHSSIVETGRGTNPAAR